MRQLIHLLDFAVSWGGVAPLLGAGLVAARPRRAHLVVLGVLLAAALLAGAGAPAARYVLYGLLGTGLGAGLGRGSRGEGTTAVAVLALLAWAFAAGAAPPTGPGALLRALAWTGLPLCALSALLVARERPLDRVLALALVGVALLLVWEGRVRIASGAACAAVLVGGLLAQIPSTKRLHPLLVAVLLLSWTALTAPGRGSGAYVHPEGLAVEEAVEVEVLATGFRLASSLTISASGRVFVGEFATGRILELLRAGEVWTPTARATLEPVRLPPGAVRSSEAGLWGLAVSPDERWLVAMALHSWDSAEGAPPRGTSRVLRFPMLPEGLGEPQIVLEGLPAANTHSGGALAFEPSGALLVSVGEAGGSDSPLAGTILRVDLDGAAWPGNPTEGSPILAGGFRNPYGLAPHEGVLFATENGPACCDRLLRVEPGGDHGWPRYGARQEDAALMADDPAVVAPLWDSGGSRISPTGLVVRPGRRLWFGTWHTAALHEVRLNAAGDGLLAHRIVWEAAAARVPTDSPYRFAGGFSALATDSEGVVWFASLKAVGRVREARP